jgi:hypothetical protein
MKHKREAIVKQISLSFWFKRTCIAIILLSIINCGGSSSNQEVSDPNLTWDEANWDEKDWL